VTATVSPWALNAGADEVLLYTDLANPVSNSVYQRIGYRRSRTAWCWRFLQARDSYDTSTVAGLRSLPLIRAFMPADRKMVAIASAIACSMVPE
jgi:hypothetical protein